MKSIHDKDPLLLLHAICNLKFKKEFKTFKNMSVKTVRIILKILQIIVHDKFMKNIQYNGYHVKTQMSSTKGHLQSAGMNTGQRPIIENGVAPSCNTIERNSHVHNSKHSCQNLTVLRIILKIFQNIVHDKYMKIKTFNTTLKIIIKMTQIFTQVQIHTQLLLLFLAILSLLIQLQNFQHLLPPPFFPPISLDFFKDLFLLVQV